MGKLWRKRGIEKCTFKKLHPKNKVPSLQLFEREGIKKNKTQNSPPFLQSEARPLTFWQLLGFPCGIYERIDI